MKKGTIEIVPPQFGCGAAGSRTRVQTSSKTDFYMLSFQLVFVPWPAESRPTITLFLWVFELHSGLMQPYPSIFDALERDAGGPGFPEDN